MSRFVRTSLYTLIATVSLLFLDTKSLAQDPPIPADTEIVTTASGLKYSVLKKGDGPIDHPAIGDKVKVHYTGWLTDGNVFDSSKTRGQPLEFRLGEVIPGWNEGLQLMSPGDTYKLTIPPELAYGNETAGEIPPNSTLVFEVELLAIKRAPPYVPLDPEQSRTTATGLKYQVLVPGEGRSPAAEDAVELSFAFWSQGGVLLDATAISEFHITGPLANMTLPFLKEAPTLMNVGAKFRFEVSPALGFDCVQNSPVPAGENTIWELELERILEVPKFELPKPEELTTTASGLQYKLLSEGTGKSPKMYEWVTCHYSGWLLDGTCFDSSVMKGKAAQFMLGQVIQGWNEGLQLLKEGGSALFVIPAELGYGKRGKDSIPPDAKLVFRVELIKVGRE